MFNFITNIIGSLFKTKKDKVETLIVGSAPVTPTTTSEPTEGKDTWWQKMLPFTLIYGSGRIQPLYVYGLIFVILTVFMIYIRLYGEYVLVFKDHQPSTLTFTDVSVMIGLVVTCFGFYKMKG